MLDQEKALEIFARLADATYAWTRDTENGEAGETSPVFNVRLDAHTADYSRGYQLFVRIDADAQVADECDTNDSLHYLLEVAREFGGVLELENGGVAIR